MIRSYLEDNFSDLQYWFTADVSAGVDKKILQYLNPDINGFFVEAGAHDGIFQSNTLLLEQLGWTGLLIEPSDYLYENCKRNRTSIVENYALVSAEHEGDTIGTEQIILMGANSSDFCKTITFNDLVAKHNITQVDVFFLDVEGYEIDVLKGIDFSKVNIDLFVIEINYNSYKKEDLDKILFDNGYECIKNISNFNLNNCPSWPGTHQDFLYKKIK